MHNPEIICQGVYMYICMWLGVVFYGYFLQFKKTVCSIQHKRIIFGLIPLNLVSSQFSFIENKSDSQAFFKVSFNCGLFN